MINTSSPIPELVQARAKRLGLVVVEVEPDEMTWGPFDLRCAQTGYCVLSGHGLPIEGILNAMNCFERELKLPADDEDIGKVWADFGQAWL